MTTDTTISTRVYAIRSPYVLYLRDEAQDARREKLEFHVESGDYFLMLAGALGFVEEALAQCEAGKSLKGEERKILKELREDLVYVHRNYRIKDGGERDFTNRTIHRFEQGT